MSNLAEYFIVPLSSDLYRLGCNLRREVFMQEQGVSLEDEFDGKDKDATHCVAVFQGNVVGVLRILWLLDFAKIGRFAIRKKWRGQHLGQELFQFAVNHIEQKGQSRIMLEAQADRVGFYEAFGFSAYGDGYLDAGILHQAMKNY